MKLNSKKTNEPNWREITVKSNLPESLSKLEVLSRNIWWSWNSEAKALFREIDRPTWVAAESKSGQLLNLLSYDKLVALGKDADFIKK